MTLNKNGHEKESCVCESFPDDASVQIEAELARILESTHFANAPIVRAFLSYVVRATIAGQGDRIKAYTIALEVFGKGAEFDPSNNTIVRTTASRVRNALQAYYREHGHDCRVVITLSKGSYVPAFTFQNVPPPPPVDGAGEPPASQLPRSSLRIWIACCAIAAIALCLTLGLWGHAAKKPAITGLALEVRPVQYLDQDVKPLAQAIDLRLAPALSRMGVAEIYPVDGLTRAETPAPGGSQDGRIGFILKTDIASSKPPELRWQLLDATSGQLIRASNVTLPGTGPASVDNIVDKISFELLGEDGVIPLALERYYGESFSKQTCLPRAQLMAAVKDATVYPHMRECLERAVAKYPKDPSAWAILSTFYTLRTRYHAADEPHERAGLLALAGRAAAKAEELAPTAYLTKIALMQLALRQQNIEKFDAIQNYLREHYPDDIYLKLRIASRIARLGRGREALTIYNDARENWNFDLVSRAAEVALAHFVEGEYERAYHEIVRTASDQYYILILKAAIFGKLDRADKARPIIDKIITINPDFKRSFYPWFAELSWSHPLLLELADGLASAGLQVDLDNPLHSLRD